MNKEENELGFMVREAVSNAQLLAFSFEDLVAEGQPVHQVVQDIGKTIAGSLEKARSINATLFEACQNEPERKMRLELDEALYLQMGTIRKLLELPGTRG